MGNEIQTYKNGGAIQQEASTTFAQYLSARRRQLASVLPKHLTPERVCRVALTTFTRTPALMNCDMPSVFQAVQQASELGLEPGGALGQCYLVPYKNTCQLIVSYKGLIELARRSGEIESIEARAIYENDEYNVEFGLHSDLRHRPCLSGDPGRLVMVYAIARLKGGMVQFEVMTREEVESIRKRSRSGNSGPWVTDYAEMAKKTVVRRLCKFLPISSEKLAMALDNENQDVDDSALQRAVYNEPPVQDETEEEVPEEQPPEQAQQAPKKSRSQSLASRLAEKAEAKE